MAPLITWHIDATVTHRYPQPLHPLVVNAPTLAGALRAFAAHAKTCGVRWHANGTTLRILVMRVLPIPPPPVPLTSVAGGKKRGKR